MSIHRIIKGGEMEMETKRLTGKSTKDLYLSALFLALGAEYEGADRTDPKHIEFYFLPRKTESKDLPSMPTQDLDFVEKAWVNGEVVVNAVVYAESIKRMKSLVHTS